MTYPLAVDGGVDIDLFAAAGGHALHVTAGAKGAAGPGQHNHPHLGVGLGPCQTVGHRRQHLPRQGVAPVRPIHGQGQHAPFKPHRQVLGTGFVIRAHRHFSLVIARRLGRALWFYADRPMRLRAA